MLSPGGFHRFPIGRKALIVFAIPALAQFIFVAGVMLLERDRSRTEAIGLRLRAARAAANALSGHLFDQQLLLRNDLLHRDPAVPTQLVDLTRRARTLQERFARATDAEARRLAHATGQVLEAQQSVLAAVYAGDPSLAAARASDGLIARMKVFRKAHIEYIELLEVRAESISRRTGVATHRLQAVVLVGAALNLGLLALAASGITFDVKRRLQTIIENTRRLARGEPVSDPLPAGDEISEVDAAFHQMADTIERRSDELRAAHGEMESFAYSVSHDLRAPLRAIGGYARMFEEDYGETLGGDAKRYLDTIRAEASRMGHLIDDLLDFSRVSRQRVALQTVDIEDVATRCMKELTVAHPDRCIEFRCGVLPLAAADPSLIRVVLMNLLSNAVKYSAPRDVSRIEMTGEVVSGMCVYRVRDNGVGFDMRYADKLFAVFQRLHSDAQFEGTGVGLALVHRIIEKHGGTIEGHSAPGGGTTFTFTLPEAAEARHVA